MNKAKKIIKIALILVVFSLNLFIIGHKAEANVSCGYLKYCVEGPETACRLLTGSTSAELNNHYVTGGKINARCIATGGCEASAYSWWNSGKWDSNSGVAPTPVGEPSTGCCKASDCGAQTCKTASCSNNTCSYTNVPNGTSCETGKQCVNGSCQTISYSTCDANVPCHYRNANGEACRKMNNNDYKWISGSYGCGESNFCETFECGTNTTDSGKGYCGFSGSSFAWLYSGSASCPYSISVSRDTFNYQMTSSCYNSQDQTSKDKNCIHAWSVFTVSGPSEYAADYLQQSRVEAPLGRTMPFNYVKGSASHTGPDCYGVFSHCYYNYWDNIYNRSYLLVTKEECEGGRTPTGYYRDQFKIGYLTGQQAFNINCNCASCGTGFSCLNPPLYATVCSGDDTGLTQNTNSTLVSYCANNTTKCEYTCNPGYILSGGVCVISAYSCLNPPLYATICPGDNTGLTSNVNSTLVSSCLTNTTKCEYTCTPPYILSGGFCVSSSYSCLNPPLYATVCPGDNTGLTSNVNSTLVSSCLTNTTKCEYTCTPPYVLSGGVCEFPNNESVCVECTSANQSNVCKGVNFEACGGVTCPGTKDCDSSWREVIP